MNNQEKIVTYNDGKESFQIRVDNEEYERLKITKGPGRRGYELVITDTKNKTHKIIHSDNIQI